MEAVFKLTRAQVEEACLQYLAQRAVRFAERPHLANVPEQAFDCLVFTGEIALASSVSAAVPTASPAPVPVAAPETPGDAAAPVAAPTPSVLKPVSRESKLDLGSLMSPDAAPTTVKLPASTVAYRRQNS